MAGVTEAANGVAGVTEATNGAAGVRAVGVGLTKGVALSSLSFAKGVYINCCEVVRKVVWHFTLFLSDLC